eukprot:3890039-Rhodomonas_salina.1
MTKSGAGVQVMVAAVEALFKLFQVLNLLFFASGPVQTAPRGAVFHLISQQAELNALRFLSGTNCTGLRGIAFDLAAGGQVEARERAGDGRLYEESAYTTSLRYQPTRVLRGVQY